MIASDALSRNEKYACVNKFLDVQKDEVLDKRILEVHEKYNHKEI